jgi:hypothetical protein
MRNYWDIVSTIQYIPAQLLIHLGLTSVKYICSLKRKKQAKRIPPSQLQLRFDLDPLCSENDNVIDDNNTTNGLICTGEDEINEVLSPIYY